MSNLTLVAIAVVFLGLAVIISALHLYQVSKRVARLEVESYLRKIRGAGP